MKQTYALILVVLSISHCFVLSCPPTGNDLYGKTLQPVIGIDLGFTNSRVGVYKNDRLDIITDSQGNERIPSYIAFTPDGHRLVGEAAKNQSLLNPANTIFAVNRLVGHKFIDKDVQTDLSMYPFKIFSDENGYPKIQVEEAGVMKLFTPEEILAIYLQYIKATANEFLGQNVTNALISVPAYFNDAQRQAIKNAGEMAGLNIIRLINEPTAAAIAYNLHKSEFEKYFVVYDLGGSTFDVAVMTVDDGVLEILAINGNTRLGGQNFDHRLTEYLLLKMDWTWNGSDQCRSDPQAMKKLRKEAENAKIALSSHFSVEIKIDSFCNGLDILETVTRSQFEELNMDLFQETLVYADNVLKDGGISKQEVNDVILVGGSTHIPKIVELIEQHFGRKLVLNGINPEQAVVYGTAIQGGVISGMFGDPEVLAFDLYPLSLGIETAGGIMTKIVERNTQIPLSKSYVFPIKVDEQGTAPICFYQGERALARNNNMLECIALEGVTKSSRGIANIEVGISIDINALVSVSAMDTESGKLHQINIDSLLDINEEQLERMIQEAEEKADEDQVLLENIEARIGFEDYLYSVMHEISNLELSMEEKSTVLGEIRNSEVWMKSNSVAKKSEVRERMLEFNESVHPILQKYRTLENKRHDEL